MQVREEGLDSGNSTLFRTQLPPFAYRDTLYERVKSSSSAGNQTGCCRLWIPSRETERSLCPVRRAALQLQMAVNWVMHRPKRPIAYGSPQQRGQSIFRP